MSKTKLKARFTRELFLKEYLPGLLLSLITLIIYCCLLPYKEQFPHLSMSFVMIITSLLPSLLLIIFGWRLPLFIEIIYYVFIILSIEVANVLNVYSLLLYWDTVLHTLSGAVICIALHYFLYIIGEYKRQKLFISALLLFLLTMGIAAIWEFTEFGVDSFLYGNSQHFIDEGIMDTMNDLLVCAIGSLAYLLVIGIDYYFVGNYLGKAIEKTFDKSIEEMKLLSQTSKKIGD